MKKTALLLTLLVTLLCLSACGPEKPSGTHKPATPTPSTSSTVKKQNCKDGHTFTDTGLTCEKCGTDYYSATLEFKLGDTRDSYIVTGLGTCTRTVIHIPQTHKNKPVTVIASTAFNAINNRACYKITEVTIPASIQKIESNAFFHCESMKKVTIEDGVTTMGSDVFRSCISLESIRIPASLTEVPSGFVQGCTALKTVEFGGDVTALKNYCFLGCENLESIVLPDTVTEIGVSAFASCISLRNISIPVKLEVLSNSVFNDCIALEFNELQGIGYLGCEENPYLILMKILDPKQKEVVIHDDTKIVETRAFKNTEFTSLSLGKNLTVIPNTLLMDIYYLEQITVSAENPKYHTAGNCLIETDTKVLIRGTCNSVIPTDGSVTSIGYYAFSGLKGLTSIVLPDQITEICGGAFRNCTGLESVVIGSGMQVVQLESFAGCNELKTVYYKGNSADWSKINIPAGGGMGGITFGDNDEILHAQRYYYAEEKPADNGNYWHFVDGKPTVWDQEEY